jgi:hypothetical protein
MEDSPGGVMVELLRIRNHVRQIDPPPSLPTSPIAPMQPAQPPK